MAAQIFVRVWKHETGFGMRRDGGMYFPLTQDGYVQAMEYWGSIMDKIDVSEWVPVYYVTADKPELVPA